MVSVCSIYIYIYISSHIHCTCTPHITHCIFVVYARLERVKGETGNDVDTKLFLKMAVWLVVYYEFYSTGVRGGACGG